MEFVRRLESFLQLKTELEDLPQETFDNVKKQAFAKNPWFTFENIDLALKGIIYMLEEPKLSTWAGKYGFDSPGNRKIGVISAGNIPMVGFHDALSVLLSGHHLYIKLSHQDDTLLPFLFNLLRKNSPEWSSRIHVVDQLKNMDAIIATGSDNSARYFEYYFKHIPSIIRKNRTSLAILTGDETSDELIALGSDIYQYFGFGCRNVSKLLLPENYDVIHLLDHLNNWNFLSDNHKYVNNYNYQRAIFSLEQIPYLDNGFSTFTQNTNLVSPTSVIYYDFYQNENERDQYLRLNQQKIQCLVGNDKVANRVPFGKTQMPEVWDYADNVDTMAFLASIK